VTISNSERYDEENLLLDRETLARNMETILSGDACAADVLAGLFVELREAIEGGLAGINRTRATLALGVELAYLHSRAHASAVALYRLSREGQLRVEDEPLSLTDAAIARTAARAGGGAGGRRGAAGGLPAAEGGRGVRMRDSHGKRGRAENGR
jgi:hypothetical protein